MFQWKKIGRVFNPVEVTERAWLKEFAQAPSTLIYENFVRVYFSCRPPADEKGQYVSYSAFVDFKRDDLTQIVKVSDQPILKLGDLGTFDEFGTYPVSVIRYKSELRAYYAGWTRCESVPFNVAIGCALSNNNGVTFEKMGQGPILSYSVDEPFILSGPKVRIFNNKWYLFYIAGKKWVLDNGKPEPVYRIRMATSTDGIEWEKHNKDIIETKVEEDEAQASPDVFFYDGMYHMFFCYRYSKGYRSKEKGYRIGYAFSADLINWIRDDSKAGIHVSNEGWDDEMISYPHVFELDNSLYMLYLGNQVGRYGFGLAKLENYQP
ncbi:glycoside hydrolase family protein [Lacibacter sediminis]|uniref:Glycosylase n=1 Tax=Lacibacter sediminis TaxID=2760713 RepID=A0A7G5XHM9_9BACT|nr:glycosylase [Lacibacter sediminis]QNA44982.1 glycosylase [Lacibacter sediminis]